MDIEHLTTDSDLNYLKSEFSNNKYVSFDPDESYNKEDQVIYNDQIWESTINNNVGNFPGKTIFWTALL